MVRIIKDYNERKAEFLDTAQELFFTKGYKQTAVDTIIRKMGLSKGTFYYYFKSKEDLLDALTVRMSERILNEVLKIVKNDELDAVDKLNKAFIATRTVKIENIDLLKVLLKVIYDDRNLLFRHKIYRKSVEILSPVFSEIIRQGIKEKVFHTKFPDEAAKLIFEMAYIFGERIPWLFFGDEKDLDKVEKEFRLYENAIERIIGAEEGKIRIVDRRIINYFHEKMNI